jgi:hypothetical protein
MLLGYVDGDHQVQFASGTRNDTDLRAVLQAIPARSKGQGNTDSRPGGLTLMTTFSPIRLNSAEPIMAAWAQGTEGPCIIWVDVSPEGGQLVSMLAFQRTTLADVGIDLTPDLREQYILGKCDANLTTVGMAVRLYARDHDGRCPPHSTGPALVEDLQGYVQSTRFFGSAYAPDEMRLRLLYPGATRSEILAEAARNGEVHVPWLELRGDDDLMFYQYTDGSVRVLRADGREEIVSSWDDPAS